MARVFISYATAVRVIAYEVAGGCGQAAGHEVFLDDDPREGISLGETGSGACTASCVRFTQ
jgi:hypothetical protein